MKFKKCLSYVAVALLGAASLSSCKDDATLANSKSVYIDIFPTSFSICVGDTIDVSATVSNENGDVIECPVEWTADLVDNKEVIKVLEKKDTLGNVIGHRVTPLQGTQKMDTKLRARISTGQEAWTSVEVTSHNANGVVPEKETMRVYNTFDTAWFRINPAELLLDFEPVVTFINDSIKLAPTNPIVYDDSIPGRVGVRFQAPRISGTGAVILTIGEELNEASGRVNVSMLPKLEVSFYTPGEDGSKRMPPNTLPMYWVVTKDALMDLNSEQEFWICVNPIPGFAADIANAKEAYSIRTDGGNSAILRQCIDKDTTGGFDIKIVIGTRTTIGSTTFEVVFPDTICTINVTVDDFVNNHPVDEIVTTPADRFEIAVGQSKNLTVTTLPDGSFNYWQPVITCDDPELVEIGGYNITDVTIRGLKTGSSVLRFVANQCVHELPITVTEGVNNIVWGEGRVTSLFEGQTTDWGVNVFTTSGNPARLPIEFISSNENVAIGQGIENVFDAGRIVAKGIGTASIRAKVYDVMSDSANVTVIAVPTGDLVISDVEDYESIGLYDDGGDAVFYMPAANGQPDIFIHFEGRAAEAYDDPFDFDAANGTAYVLYNGAKAEITAGTFNYVWDSSYSFRTANFSLTVTVGDKSFVLKANNLKGGY